MKKLGVVSMCVLWERNHEASLFFCVFERKEDPGSSDSLDSLSIVTRVHTDD
jgi:hypothetical protein